MCVSGRRLPVSARRFASNGDAWLSTRRPAPIPRIIRAGCRCNEHAPPLWLARLANSGPVDHPNPAGGAPALQRRDIGDAVALQVRTPATRRQAGGKKTGSTWMRSREGLRVPGYGAPAAQEKGSDVAV
jgi:hypothetical protein